MNNEFLQHMTELYGDNLQDRIAKLGEEYEELHDAAAWAVSTRPWRDDVIDELADVNIIVAHIAHILGVTQEQLFDMAKDKITKRETNPNYKR